MVGTRECVCVCKWVGGCCASVCSFCVSFSYLFGCFFLGFLDVGLLCAFCARSQHAIRMVVAGLFHWILLLDTAWLSTLWALVTHTAPNIMPGMIVHKLFCRTEPHRGTAHPHITLYYHHQREISHQKTATNKKLDDFVTLTLTKIRTSLISFYVKLPHILPFYFLSIWFIFVDEQSTSSRGSTVLWLGSTYITAKRNSTSRAKEANERANVCACVRNVA